VFGSELMTQNSVQIKAKNVKFHTLEHLDKIREEFSTLEAHYHSSRQELEHMAAERVEMQGRFVAVSFFKKNHWKNKKSKPFYLNLKVIWICPSVRNWSS